MLRLRMARRRRRRAGKRASERGNDSPITITYALGGREWEGGEMGSSFRVCWCDSAFLFAARLLCSRRVHYSRNYDSRYHLVVEHPHWCSTSVIYHHAGRLLAKCKRNIREIDGPAGAILRRVSGRLTTC